MNTELVRFHDTELVCFQKPEHPIVAISPICENIGLHVDRALRSLKSDEILGPHTSIETYQVGEKQARQYVCLPIQCLPGWLFSINPNRVKPSVKPRLVLFQRECFQVLYDHFFGKTRAIHDNVKAIHDLRLELRQVQNEAAQHEVNLKRCKGRMIEILAQIDALNAESGFQLGLFEVLPEALPLN